MADIVFSDWNNYTDRDGSAQTLDWDNLPAFLDIGVGMTALVQAINERIDVVTSDASNRLDYGSFETLESRIDNKIFNYLIPKYANKNYLGGIANWNNLTSDLFGAVLNKTDLFTELGEVEISSTAFYSHSKLWLKQRYNAINFLTLAILNNLFSEMGGMIYYLYTKTLQYYSDFNQLKTDTTNFAWTYAEATTPYSGYVNVNITSNHGLNNYLRVAYDVGFNCLSEKKATVYNIQKMFTDIFPITFENPDTTESQREHGVYSIVNNFLNNTFDFHSEYGDGNISTPASLYRSRGYHTVNLNIGINFAAQMNVPDGFKFQP